MLLAFQIFMMFVIFIALVFSFTTDKDVDERVMVRATAIVIAGILALTATFIF